MRVLTVLNYPEDNGMEEMGLVTPTQDQHEKNDNKTCTCTYHYFIMKLHLNPIQ